MQMAVNARVSGQPVTVSGEAVFISGTISVMSGACVNVGSGVGVTVASGVNTIVQSGLGVIVTISGSTGQMISGQALYVQVSGYTVPISGQPVSISGQAVFISGTVSILSGSYVNIGSNTVVSIGSGISYQMSGANVIASVTVGSGLYVVISGQGVTVASGVNVIIQSGAPVSLQSGSYVNIGSGIGVLVATSGQGYPAIGGQYRPSMSSYSSGQNATVATDLWGAILVDVVLGNAPTGNTAFSGLPVMVGSGTFITVSISGQAIFVSGTVNILSGAYVNIGSGVGVLIQSGINVNIGSGIGMIQASGAYIINDSGVRVVLQSGLPMTMSGQANGIPILGVYDPVNRVLASGQLAIPNMGNADGDLRVDIHMADSSGLPVQVGSGVNVVISGQPVYISGTVSLISGGYVNIGSGVGVLLQSGVAVNIGSGVGVLIQSGINVNVGSGIGVITSISGQAIFVSGTINIISGAYVNIGSGIGIILNSGIGLGVSASGTAVLTNLAGNSGQWVNIGSGVGIILNSGIGLGVSASGTNVILASGASVIVATSGQGFPAIGGINRGLFSGSAFALASGVIGIPTMDTDGSLIVDIDKTDSSGLSVTIQSGTYVNIGSGVGVIAGISGQAIFVSGTVNILSGAYVNIGSNTVISIGSGIAYYMSGANVTATVSVGSGLYIVMSGQGVSIASGIAYQMSGANVIATVSVGSGLYTVAGGINRAINSGGQVVLASGVIAVPSLDVNGNLVVMTSGQTANMISGQALYVQISGYKVAIDSGIAYQMSGANVIATVSVGSGLGTLVTTSGQGFPAIGGINRAINSGGNQIFASGTINIPSTDVNGNLVAMTSGQTANMISGQALFVQMSGVNAVVSGIYHLNLPIGAGTVVASTFIVNTSAVQLPNTAGREHLLQIMDSGVYWIGGVNTVKSGVGFMWQGIPGTDYRSQLLLKIANLNLLYMTAQTVSGKITIMSMN